MTARRRRRRKTVVFSIISLALVSLALLAVFRRREAAIPVQVQKVERRDVVEKVKANGNIQPVLRVVISPEVPGEIIDLPVEEGAKVERGDVIVRIKSDNYEASKRSAEASYQSALANQALSKANLEKAQLDYDRAAQLHREKLISDSDFLAVKTSLSVAEATYQTSIHQTAQAKAAVERAEEELKKTTLLAPMAGTVINRKSEVGERVVGSSMMPGTEIMSIAKLDQMEAWIEVGEMDIVLVEKGQKATLEVDAFRDRQFSGVVTEIANSAKTTGAGSQQETTKFDVKILIEQQANFRPGMSVTADIETRYRTNVLSVPIQCVTTRLPKNVPKANPKNPSDDSDSGENASAADHEETIRRERPKPIEVVFVVEDGVAKAYPVERGISDDDYVEIVSGLGEGQEVVSGGYNAIMRELEDGKKVTLSKPSEKGEPDEDKR